MEQVTELSPTSEKKKPGRKPAPKGPSNEQLLERIERLEACLEKTTSLTGNGNILLEFGLKRWNPGKKDLSKYA